MPTIKPNMSDIMCCTHYGHHFAPFFEHVSMVGYVIGYVVCENAKEGQICGAMYCGQYGQHFVPSLSIL